MKTEHQKHAAKCRHASAIQAKRIYCQELSEYFGTYRKNLPIQERLHAFASSRRQKISDYVARFGFRESTFRTWLREWKASNALIL